MKRFNRVLSLLLAAGLIVVAQDTTTSVPTTAGQIGVNPVLGESGDPNDYFAVVGDSDSAFFVQEGGEYNYIATAGDELAVTTTNGATSTIRVAATTATADADRLTVGDIAVILPATVALSLKDAVFASVVSCGGAPAKLRRDVRNLLRRQDISSEGASCMIRAAHEAAQNEAVWGGIEAAEWEQLGIPLFEGVEDVFRGVVQIGINAAIRNRMAIFLTAGSIAGGVILNLGIDAARQAVNLRKIRIPKEGAGRPAEEEEEKSGRCDPSAEPNIDSPGCSDTGCVGVEGRCTVGEHAGCRCRTATKPLVQCDTRDWFEFERQQVLDEIEAGVDSASGTNITVNRGCILIDDSPRCQGSDPYHVADTGTGSPAATFHGKFVADPNERSERPGCVLEASWSSDIQAINYGADDCLYNGNAQIACCSETTPGTKPNPYFGGASTAKPSLTSPSNLNGKIDCLDKTDGGGTDTGGTFWTDTTTFVFGERITNEMIISTAERSKCLASGDTTDEQGVKLSSYCVVSCQSKACFVIADKAPSFGVETTGSSSITGSDLLTYAANSARTCPGSNKVTVGAGPGVQFAVALCMAGEDHPEICTTP